MRDGGANLSASLVAQHPHRSVCLCRNHNSWSIWPPTIQRQPSATEAVSDKPMPTSHLTGKPLVAEKAMRLLRPDHHQFYGPWRSFEVGDDGLEKYLGYKGKSEQVRLNTAGGLST